MKARGPEFKTANWLQGWPNLSLFQVRSNEYQELLGTYLYKANCLLVVTLQPWDIWIQSLKRRQKNLFFKLLIIFNYTSRGISQLVNACSKSTTHWPTSLRVILILLLFILGMYYWVVSFTVSHRGILKLLV